MILLTLLSRLPPTVALAVVLVLAVSPLVAIVLRGRVRNRVERERTRRLARVIDGVPGAQRAAVLQAQASVEASYPVPSRRVNVPGGGRSGRR
jgi:hypothetical protein